MCMDIGASGIAPPDFKTQAEIADIIKVPERTLEDWRLNHVGPPYMKLGRHVRYDLSEVFAWAREQRHA
ncbi:helix-turn-helix domain-containing protein [uncultured Microbacterium sp.]|uniref:helix-turn-helix domain-containing protein n=2 Tax=Microbacterium TaxID=33882 RepID=UPI000B0F63F7|nr:helix-turn-helix domain-containing protein [uncultured Microbacterium sp.]